MAKPELGLKRVCVSCGARFYDLNHAPAVCPKCGTEQPQDQPRFRRAGGNPIEDKRPKKAPAAAEDADVEVEGAEEEEAEEEDVLEDTSDLDDDADLGGEIEVEKDRDEGER